MAVVSETTPGLRHTSATGVTPIRILAILPVTLAAIDAQDAELARVGRPRSRGERGQVVRGAVNVLRPFPGGNGRSCATCHDPGRRT